MELDFTNDVVEKLLLKKALTDKNWLNILSRSYDKRWFKVKEIGIVLKLALKYYEKYNVCPSNKILQLLSQLHLELPIL